jgi:hypothetical protein
VLEPRVHLIRAAVREYGSLTEPTNSFR